tara:strand:- start:80004 stop:80297 length:294 start_codon:yes stop_codon:yes gene_type:complete
MPEHVIRSARLADERSGRFAELIQSVQCRSGFFKTAQSFDKRHQGFEILVVVLFKQFGKSFFVHDSTSFAIGTGRKQSARLFQAALETLIGTKAAAS